MIVRPTIDVSSLDALVTRAAALAATGERRILGVAGPPGAGKSTLCAALLTALGERATLVGMDGFHLADDELRRLGRRDRKGAPDTFDVGGYVALLDRLRGQSADVVYAPVFDRAAETSVGSAIAVYRQTPLVITEGNYLLHAGHGWAAVAERLDETWFLDITDDERRRRLVGRRRSYGDSPEQAQAWVTRVDDTNAAAVVGDRVRADLVVRVL